MREKPDERERGALLREMGIAASAGLGLHFTHMPEVGDCLLLFANARAIKAGGFFGISPLLFYGASIFPILGLRAFDRIPLDSSLNVTFLVMRLLVGAGMFVVGRTAKPILPY